MDCVEYGCKVPDSADHLREYHLNQTFICETEKAICVEWREGFTHTQDLWIPKSICVIERHDDLINVYIPEWFLRRKF